MLITPTPESSHANRIADLAFPPRAIVISGTLGSGKTTLLNHLLKTAPECGAPGSFVVIENDIGTMNTDQARLAADPEAVLAITAGCICCNDLHSLQAAVSQLRELPEIKTLFIETTGIANPGAVKDLLHKLQIPTLVIVTVDVKHFDDNQLLGRNNETIPHADIVALTWTHSAVGERDTASVIGVTGRIRSLNPEARLVEIDPSGAPVEEAAPLVCGPVPAIAGTGRPSAQDFQSRLQRLFGVRAQSHTHSHHHHEYTVTLSISDECCAEDVVAAIRARAPRLMRAKGHVKGVDLDCVQGDWTAKEIGHPRARNWLTLIDRQPLRASDFPSIHRPGSGELTGVDIMVPAIRERAVSLVDQLIAQIPVSVVENGRMITQIDAGEGWNYVLLPNFPEDVKQRFMRATTDFWLKQAEALQTGIFHSHPNLPYYTREVGNNLSWLLIDCGERVDTWGLRETLEAHKPATLFFEGLAIARNAIHLRTFAERDSRLLRARLDMLAREQGKPDPELATRAVDNCVRLCVDGSWNRARSVLSDYLKSIGS
jgi:G3E family GTPase